MFPLSNSVHQAWLNLALTIVLLVSFVVSLRSNPYTGAVGVVIWLAAWILFAIAAFAFFQGANAVALICGLCYGALLVLREVLQREIGRPDV